MEPDRLRAIISAARAGSDWAYREILATFGPRLYGFFYRATLMMARSRSGSIAALCLA